MKKRLLNLKEYYQRVLTFPIFLFLCILIISFVAFWGRKFTRSYEEVPPKNIEGEVLGEQVPETTLPCINDCAFEEAPLKSCDQDGNLELERNLTLEYQEVLSSIPPDWGATGNTTIEPHPEVAGHLWHTKVSFRLAVKNNVAYVELIADAPDVETGEGIAHYQFAIHQADGTKIIDQGTHKLLLDSIPATWTVSESDVPGFANYVAGGIYAAVKIGEFGPHQNYLLTEICYNETCGGQQLPPTDPTDPEPNPTWSAEWAATVRIKNLPSFEYFATTEYPGTEDADYAPTPGTGKVRVTPGQIWDPELQEWIKYDPSISVSGYGKLRSSDKIAKPQYDAGSAVLIAAMGDESDYTWEFSVPRQFLTYYAGDIPSKVDTETTHSSGFFEIIDQIKDFLKKYWDLFLSIFPRPKLCEGEWEIEELYPYNETSGYESLFDNGQFTYTIEDIIFKSDLAYTVGLECEKYENNEYQCKIPTYLQDCNICYPDPNDPTIMICNNLEYGTGNIIEGRKQIFLECLKDHDIYVRHYSEGFDKFELSGALYILETYWKKLQLISPRRICHKKNRGIEAELEGKLYDVNDDTCSGESGALYCEPDPEFSCTKGIKSEMKAYFPYLGTMIFSTAAYLDLQQAAIEEEVADLPDCPEVDDKDLCYCEEGEYDKLGLYLFKYGALTSDAELSIIGATRDELVALVGEPEPWNGDDGDDNGYDGNGDQPPIEAPSDLWETLVLVQKAVEAAYPGQCIPPAFIAAVMAGESPGGLQNYRLDQMYYAENNNWCERMNRECGNTTIPTNISDQEIYNIILELRDPAKTECSRPISQVSTACQNARTLDGRVWPPHQCCHVNGIMQFDIATWIGGKYEEKAGPICASLGADFSSAKPARAHACASIVSAAIKLSASCDRWAADEEGTLRYEAGCYVGGCDPTSAYANKVWNRYDDFPEQYKFHP